MYFLSIWLKNLYNYKENREMPEWRKDILKQNIEKFKDHQFFMITDDREMSNKITGINIIPYGKIKDEFLKFIEKDEKWCSKLEHVNILTDLLRVWMATKTEFLFIDTDVKLFIIPKFTDSRYPYFGSYKPRDKEFPSMHLIYTNGKKDWFKIFLKYILDNLNSWPVYNVTFNKDYYVNLIDRKHYVHCRRVGLHEIEKIDDLCVFESDCEGHYITDDRIHWYQKRG